MQKSFRNLIIPILALSFCWSGLVKADEKVPIKAVVQINAEMPKQVEMALKNLANASKQSESEGTNVDFSVVVFGPALKYFVNQAEPTVAHEYENVRGQKNIHFIACENSLKILKIDKTTLLPGFKTVPSGAWEVLKLQTQGAVYLRP
jgi:intracellular sulfur oxidation DsrE/DsrF family protein